MKTLHSLNDLLNTKPENEAACCVRILCISFGSPALQASKGQWVTALPCNTTKIPTPHMHTFLPWRLPGSSHTLTQRFSWMWCCINTKEQNHWENQPQLGMQKPRTGTNLHSRAAQGTHYPLPRMCKWIVLPLSSVPAALTFLCSFTLLITSTNNLNPPLVCIHM